MANIEGTNNIRDQYKKQPDANVRAEYEPGWKKRGWTTATTEKGDVVIFDKPIGDPHSSWNPEVKEGQKLQKELPVTVTDANDTFHTNQLVALHDPHMMTRIKDLIEREYGSGVGKNLHHLTPREAVEIAQRILDERTEYDLQATGAGKVFQAKQRAALIERKKMSLEEFMRVSLAARMMHDRRDVESLLKEKDDKDVVCRNKAEVFIVLFEALKQLQEKNESLLETTTAQTVRSASADRMVGTLADGSKVYVFPETGDYFAVKADGDAVENPQTIQGEHSFPKGEVRLLSKAETEQITFTIGDRPFRDLSTVGHALVQMITEDVHGRFHVLPINVTADANGRGPNNAEKLGVDYLNDTLLSWKKDMTWSQLRKSYDSLIKNIPENSHTCKQLIANYPQLMRLEAKEQKRHLTPQEKEWCYEQFLKSKARIQTWRETDKYEQQSLASIATAFVEDGDYDKAAEVLELAKAYKPAREHTKKTLNLTGYNALFDQIEKVMKQKRGT